MQKLAKRYRLACLIAEPQHTGDNAAMIGFAAYADPEGTRNDAISIEPALRLG
jgi:N6-L-threonylcarbamoyladenine synthase